MFTLYDLSFAGKLLSYNALLHPHCHITFDKSHWKNQKKINTAGKLPEEILSAYKYPVIRVTEFIVQSKETVSVIFLSKLKLLGCEKYDSPPDILRQKDVEVIMGNCEVVTRSREGLEQFDVPSIEINKSNDYEDEGSTIDYKYSLENRPLRTLSEEFSLQGFARSRKQQMKKMSPADLYSGELAPLGPAGLNVLCLCPKCSSLTYASDSKISNFRPSARTLIESLTEILPSNQMYEFCSCDDENDQFRKEFQNKCMVVNQDTTATGQDRKVQCILVSKESTGQPPDLSLQDSEQNFKGSQTLINEKTSTGYSCEMINTMVPISRKTARVSSKLRLCEHCGVEERDMAACKHCAKVSPSKGGFERY